MQTLFKNISIDLTSTFHPKSFFLYDIILLSDKFDDLFTVSDKPYVHKESSLNSLLLKVYGGSWDYFFLDLYNYEPVQEGRALSIFMTDTDYVMFLGKFVSSVFPALSVESKSRVIKAVCNDTRFIKSAVFDSDRRLAYLAFNPSDETIHEAACQNPCKLPPAIADSLTFNWIVGHHLGDPQRFLDKVLKSVQSINYHRFRLSFMRDLHSNRIVFSFNPDEDFSEVMRSKFLIPSFETGYSTQSFYADAEGNDVKEFFNKYGVEWYKEMAKNLSSVPSSKLTDYLDTFTYGILDKKHIVDICDKPEELKKWFRSLVEETYFANPLNFPLLSEWFRLHQEGFDVKIV
jgi:hypothetical protein